MRAPLQRSTMAVAAVYVLLWLFLPAALVPFVPGIFFVGRFTPWRDRTDFLSWWAGVNFLSIAFWIAAPWLTAIPFVTISGLFHAVAMLGLVFLVARPVRLPRPDRNSLIYLGLLLALYFVPFFNRIGFHRGDMTMNMYYAELLLLHDGVPGTHQPLLEIPTFGQYALGYHFLVALSAKFSPLPIYSAALFVFCYVFHLFFLAFVFLSPPPANRIHLFVGAYLFLFFSHYPQFMFQWGSATTILSLTYLILLFPILTRLTTLTRPDCVAVSFLCAAAPLSHLIPVFGFLLFFPAYFLIVRGPPRRQDIRPALWILAGALVLFFGQATRLPGPPGPQWVEWSHSWNQSQLEAVQPLAARLSGSEEITLLNVPFAYVFIFGPMSVALSIAAAAVSRNRKHQWLFLSFLAISLLILASKVRSFLPFDYALYPERVLMFVGVPATLLLTELTRRFSAKLNHVILVASIAAFLATSLVIRNYPFRSYYRLYKDGMIGPAKLLTFNIAGGDYVAYAFDDVNASLSRDAVTAMLWIRDHVPRDEVFDCDEESGGHLIPIIAGNKILRPHYQQFWYERHMKAWQARQDPRFYLGSVAHPPETEPDGRAWRVIAQHGSVAVYRKD